MSADSKSNKNKWLKVLGPLAVLGVIGALYVLNRSTSQDNKLTLTRKRAEDSPPADSNDHLEWASDTVLSSKAKAAKASIECLGAGFDAQFVLGDHMFIKQLSIALKKFTFNRSLPEELLVDVLLIFSKARIEMPHHLAIWKKKVSEIQVKEAEIRQLKREKLKKLGASMGQQVLPLCSKQTQSKALTQHEDFYRGALKVKTRLGQTMIKLTTYLQKRVEESSSVPFKHHWAVARALQANGSFSKASIELKNEIFSYYSEALAQCEPTHKDYLKIVHELTTLKVRAGRLGEAILLSEKFGDSEAAWRALLSAVSEESVDGLKQAIALYLDNSDSYFLSQSQGDEKQAIYTDVCARLLRYSSSEWSPDIDSLYETVQAASISLRP